MDKNELETQEIANGTFQSRKKDRVFKSAYGKFVKSVSLFISFTMLYQSAYYAAAFDMSFSAVKNVRSHQRSGFFKPNEVKDLSEKKRNLINQRNSLSKNLNHFNRKQSAINRETKQIGRDIGDR